MKPSPFAFKLFGNFCKKRREKYFELNRWLRQARIPLSPEMYMAEIYLYSIIAAIAGACIGLFISWMWVALIGLPEHITKIPARQLGGLLEYREILVIILLTFLFMAAIGALTFWIGKSYAKMVAGGRKKNINKLLPYSITYMYALSRGGMNIIEIFKSLAEAKDTYGEVASEMRMIVNDMEFFGYDLRTAIQRAMEHTPSDDLQELLHSLLTVIDSGGNITTFFGEKADQYLNKAVMDQKGFLETLGLMAESYVTAFVAGPLFIVIIQTVIAMMGQGGEIVLYAIIYLLLPVGSIGFLFAIYAITPQEVGGTPIIELETRYATDKEIKEDSEERELYLQLQKARKKIEFRKKLNLFRFFMEKPLAVLYVSGPCGIAFFFIGLLSAGPKMFEVIDDYIIGMAFVMLAPLVFFYEAKSRKEKKVKKEIPDFLHRLALTNEIGMTVPESIELMSKQEVGSLTPEIKKVWRDISWGLSVTDAFARFANRLKIASVSRTIKLLTQALKSTGDVREVLEITAKDARTAQTLEKERSVNMLIYIVIIYMAFGVFTVVVMIMSSSFLPIMAEAGAKAAGAGVAGLMGAVDIAAYKRIFFHAALIMGFCSGLMAGQMGEGKVLAGLKHSLIMLFAAFFMFRVFI